MIFKDCAKVLEEKSLRRLFSKPKANNDLAGRSCSFFLIRFLPSTHNPTLHARLAAIAIAINVEIFSGLTMCVG